VDLDKHLTDLGDFTITEYFDIEKISLENAREKQRILTLGGDHSISFPVVKAAQATHGDFDILHIDAHADLYHEFEGDPYSHACPFARIMENGLAQRLVQVGIRTLNDHQREQTQKYGVEVHEMKDWEHFEMPHFERPIYLSLDLDGLDPAFAPGVSHHEPGGLTTREVISIIHSLNVPIIGADIVEYNPDRDNKGQTAHVAAKLLKEIVGKMVLNG
jgi:agmatinase